ncbi:hypothetical protein M569_08800, partial [Genlisea aurea]
MAVVPGYQFYPKTASFVHSLQSSVSDFQLRRLQLISFCSSARPSASRGRFNPSRGRKRDGGRNLASGTLVADGRGASSSWMDFWNAVPGTQHVNRKPQAVVDYRNADDVSDAEEGTSTSTGVSTMQRIVAKLKKFGYLDDDAAADENEAGRQIVEKGSVEDIFSVEEGLLPNSRGGISHEFPFGDEIVAVKGDVRVRFPWEKKNDPNVQKSSLDSRKARSLAESTLPESEVTRLRNLALRTKNKTRIKGAGVTQEIVEAIHEKWKTAEVVRLKIEGPSALNMKRMHEILERKTGGLVVWRSGSSVALYRGVKFEDTSRKLNKRITGNNGAPRESYRSLERITQGSSELSDDGGKPMEDDASFNGDPDRKIIQTTSYVKYEDEVEKLLESLGPRYEDWPGDGPLPVDADLLPGAIPGYQPPFRLLPYGVRSTLGIKEATTLRRIARGLPPHFALGRSRNHQGLAAAMIKVWERSSIAKIALKRGVQLTTSEWIAEDLKRLTGGMLLSRNKEYLVFYRGKDFLSPDVAEALLEKERLAKTLQDEEERARLRASAFVAPTADGPADAGTLKETLDADTRWGKRLDDVHKEKVMREAEILRHANIVRKLESKLDLAERKLAKAERALFKVEKSLNPAEPEKDPEAITDEERFMFRKLGLRMKAFLLLGRRGVFDGTVENMHLHWKYRELVKIIVKAPKIEEAKTIALALEAESGGVLVSLDKISKGFAIIVYRGRDYKRPPLLRPKNLLTKRKALARSIELQRHQ